VRPLAIAIQFLTRLPVRLDGIPNEREVGASLNYYPFVGLILGLLLAAAGWILQSVPDFLGAALLTVLWILLTGALHLDGLADSADAWIGGLGDKEKTLRIMKDPACGPAGVVAIMAMLLLKVAAISSLFQSGGIVMIFLVPLLARTAVMLLVSLTPYARSDGLARSLTQHANPPLQVTITVCVLLPLLGLMGGKLLAILLPLLIVVYILRRNMLQRIDGVTGDLAGAVLEISEVTLLLSLSMV